MKKTLGGVFAALAGLVAGCVAPIPPPPPPPTPATTYTLTVHVFRGDPAGDHKAPDVATSLHVKNVPGSAALALVDRRTDGAGNVNYDGLLAGTYSACVNETLTYPLTCADVTVPGPELNLSLTPLFVSLPPLSTSGPIFTANGQPWRWKGVTAFGLLHRFAQGEDIGPFLDDFAGFNILRVWPYVEWGPTGWDAPSPDVVIAFVKRAEQAGFYVELTLLTDDAPARIDQAKRLVQALTAARPPNVLLEAGNEPETHKAINTAALIPALQASGFLWTTGNYEDSAKMRGSYGVTHTARDGEWPRRAHDLLEFYAGGGPNAPSDPAHKFPIVADEPAKLQDVGGNHAQDFLAYFASCSLLGAGATFHFESGKYGSRPVGEEISLAAIALQGLNAFPADAPKGPYRRPDEGAATLRTYTVGPYTVRIRPTDGAVIRH